MTPSFRMRLGVRELLSLVRRVRQVESKRRLLQHPGVSVAANAKLSFDRVAFQPQCELEVGSGSIVEARLSFERPRACIRIGRNSYVGGSHLVSATSVRIGDDVLISWGCTIVDHDSHSLDWSQRANDVRNWYEGRKDWTHVKSQAVTVGSKAWIGFNCAILKGITVGEGAVVAACSVVTKDVAPYTLVGGNPAREIRRLREVSESQT